MLSGNRRRVKVNHLSKQKNASVTLPTISHMVTTVTLMAFMKTRKSRLYRGTKNYFPLRLGPFLPVPADTPFFDLAPSCALWPRSLSKAPEERGAFFGVFLPLTFDAFDGRRSGTPILDGCADFFADRMAACNERLSPISASSSIANFRLFAFLDRPESLLRLGCVNKH